MRRAEITPELIELSKKAKELGFASRRKGRVMAKELGFSRDVEEGDWIAWDSGVGGVSIHLIHEKYIITDNEWLILSFSRCLEWLQKEKYGVNLAFNTFIWDQYIFFVGTQSSRAKTHHEAIAKAVIKILEGEQ